MWLHVTFTFKIVQRRRADRTLNHLILIEHCKLNDHPIEVVALDLASPQRHCEFSASQEFTFTTLIGRCQYDSVFFAKQPPQAKPWPASIRAGLLGLFEATPAWSRWPFGRAGEAHLRSVFFTPAKRD
jgi:hypothetical protein